MEVDGVCTIEDSGSATVTIVNAAQFANNQKAGQKMGIHCSVLEGTKVKEKMMTTFQINFHSYVT